MMRNLLWKDNFSGNVNDVKLEVSIKAISVDIKHFKHLTHSLTTPVNNQNKNPDIDTFYWGREGSTRGLRLINSQFIEVNLPALNKE